MKPEELLFSETHEWAHLTQEGGTKIATIGISKFAVEQLTDLVYMQLPDVGRHVNQGQEFGEVESVKAVSSLYSPVTGDVIAVNADLPNKLETLNADPFGAGWVIRMRVTDEASLSKLMNYAAYQKQCATES